MRLGLAILCLAVVSSAYSQTWDKLVAPGLSYRMEVDSSVPRITHILRFSPGAPGLSVRAELADFKVYEPNEPKGRQELSALIKGSGALGGINADYFPFTGDPLGAMVRNGELVSKPYPKRSVFGWGEKWAGAAVLEWQGRIEPFGGQTFRLNGLNEECPDNCVVLNTESAGLALSKTPSIYAVIRCNSPEWKPNSRVEGTVELLYSDITSMPVQEGNAILVGRGKAAESLTKLRPGQKVSIQMDTSGFDWSMVKNVVGGGPYLVRSGRPSVDWQRQGFQDTFSLKRHPRTAVGTTREGDIVFVAVDGRQEMSDGATLDEMAAIMVRQGCLEAINLDGGGSTSINLFGTTLNRPSDGKERPVSNAILIFGEAPAGEPPQMAIQGPSRVQAGGNGSYLVIGPNGRPIPNSEVIWSSNGAAWVDQGGMLHGSKPGTSTLMAFARGALLSLPITVEPPTGK